MKGLFHDHIWRVSMNRHRAGIGGGFFMTFIRRVCMNRHGTGIIGASSWPYMACMYGQTQC